jgi:S-adenosylmethionine decarboxylase
VVGSGIEWLIEAFGCAESKLRDPLVLASLFRDIVAEVGLKPVGDPVWHRFPEPGGITGMWLLSESHLTVHSFPEFGSACLNLFCCRERPSIDWQAPLHERLGAQRVVERELRRPFGSDAP